MVAFFRHVQFHSHVFCVLTVFLCFLLFQVTMLHVVSECGGGVSLAAYIQIFTPVNPIQPGPFCNCSGGGGGKSAPPPETAQTAYMALI